MDRSYITRFDGVHSRYGQGTRSDLVHCFRCGKDLEYPFLRVVQKEVGTRFFHEDCWETKTNPRKKPEPVVAPRPI